MEKVLIKVELVKDLNEKGIKEVISLAGQLSSKFSPEGAEEWIQKVLDFPAADFLVARKESRIVGILTLVSYPIVSGYDKAWIEDVVVDTGCRGQGVGAKLVLEALEIARKRKFKAVNLTSRPEREAANHLYRKLGFKPVETNCYRYFL